MGTNKEQTESEQLEEQQPSKRATKQIKHNQRARGLHASNTLAYGQEVVTVT